MSGTDTAAMVPGVYDVVIDGYGYVTARTIDPNMPFRVQQAQLSYSPTFVDRSNVSNSFGDQTMDFFMSIRQRDWSLGEQQKFFRAGQDGRYWQGTNVDVSTPGQAKLTRQTPSLGFSATAVTTCPDDYSGDRSSVIVATSVSLVRVQVDATITNLGAHGLGATPKKFGIVNDGASTYITTTSAGTVGVRKWNGTAFSTFSASGADSLAMLNNTLYGWRESNADLVSWDSAGTLTSIFPWKSVDGGATAGLTNINTPILRPFGGKLLILFPYTQEAAELWVYDGTSTRRLAVFPPNFAATSMVVLYGLVFIGGNFTRSASTTTMNARPAVLFFDGSQIGLVWRANDYGTTALTSSSIPDPGPALGINDGRLIFTDDTTATLMSYDPATGAVSTIGSYTGSSTNAQMASTGSMVLMTRNQTTGYYFPHVASYNTSGTVISSLVDFDSSLPKQFRGIKVEFDAASDGNGGSVDIAYQTDSLTGAWTTLQAGAVSGTEYTLTSVSGHSIAVRITLNKGTSTSGPVLKSYSVRGAPVLTSYRINEFVLDLTGTAANPVVRRDVSTQTLTGEQMRANLAASIQAVTPLTVTDVTGTYTAQLDPGGCEFDEVRPGQWYARVKIREV